MKRLRFSYWATYFMELGVRVEVTNSRFEFRLMLLYWHIAICWY